MSFLTSCDYPGDGFIKDVLKYTGFMISNRNITRIVFVNYLLTTSYEEGPIDLPRDSKRGIIVLGALSFNISR